MSREVERRAFEAVNEIVGDNMFSDTGRPTTSRMVEALVRWHVAAIKRELRRVRGRQRLLGWTYLDPKFRTPVEKSCQVLLDLSDKPWPDDNFKVVLVKPARPGKGKR